MRYLAHRTLHGALILFGVSIITFLIPHLTTSPEAIAHQVLGIRAQPSAYKLFIHQNYLDRSWPQQYWHWLWGLLHGNLGLSYNPNSLGVPVKGLIGANMWRSFFFVVPPTIAAVLVAIPLGLFQAFRRNKPFDYAATTAVFVLYSTPAALLCVIMQQYLTQSWVPVLHPQGTVNTNAQEVSGAAFPWYMLHNFEYFVLPMLALLLLTVGGLSRFMRGSALDTLVQDYVRTARAKGASTSRVMFRHVLRPSTIPVITILGLSVPVILSGALIIEAAFNFPGMGILTVASTQLNDIPTVLAITLILSFATVIGNLLADVCMVLVDPRIRFEGRK